MMLKTIAIAAIMIFIFLLGIAIGITTVLSLMQKAENEFDDHLDNEDWIGV